MKLVRNLLLLLLFLAGAQPARAAATLLPNGEQCFQAVAGLNGMVGLLGTITGGTGGTTGTYGGVALTGGAGSGATANISVSGGAVTAVTILNPGTAYVVGDVLSAASGNIGSVTGFSVPVSSVAINSSLAGGKVFFYQPGTGIFKSTWFNADAQPSHQNTNPVQLDANGCAIIYGTGSYRQVVQDSLGNTVWDQITTDTSANNNTFWAGIAGGTPNVITVVDAGFNATDGSVIQFIPLFNNTGTATLNPSGFGAKPILKASSSGPVALSAGDLVAGYVANVVYLASTDSFQLLNPAPSTTATTAVSEPQGRLTLTSGTPVISSDVSGATTVFYTPYLGNQIPIYNGSTFVNFTFSELNVSLTTNQLASTIYDICVFSNNGSATAVIGPAWSNSAAGSGARGTGANSAQLQRVNGILVNAVAMTGVNGASSFPISVNQCTYVGSIFIDTSPGQVTANVSYGQNRKFGVWNAYNRRTIILKAGDPTASWSYSTTKTLQASNNVPAAYSPTVCNTGGSACNGMMVFNGLAEETINIQIDQNILVQSGSSSSGTTRAITAIGINSISAISGQSGLVGVANGAGGSQSNVYGNAVSRYVNPPTLGVTSVISLEAVTNIGATTQNVTYFSTENSTTTTGAMILSAWWNG